MGRRLDAVWTTRLRNSADVFGTICIRERTACFVCIALIDVKDIFLRRGRVQVTAAAFAKGLLDLDGRLTPILASLVRNANVSLLDDSAGASKHLAWSSELKLLGRDKDLNFDDMRIMAPTGGKSFTESLRKIKNPFKMMERLHDSVRASHTSSRPSFANIMLSLVYVLQHRRTKLGHRMACMLRLRANPVCRHNDSGVKDWTIHL